MTAAPALQFDPIAHAYTVNGIPVRSVTQILQDVGIVDYSAIPDGIRMMALERGRHVHLLTQLHDEDDLGRYDPKLTGYLDAWKRFREETGFVPELIEHQGFNELYGYAGTLDRRGSFPGKSEVLLDIKTSMIPWWVRLQLAAYCNFFPNPSALRRMAVALRADGTYRIEEFRCTETRADFNVFLSALAVVNVKRIAAGGR